VVIVVDVNAAVIGDRDSHDAQCRALDDDTSVVSRRRRALLASMASADDEAQVSRCAYGCQDATCVTGNTCSDGRSDESRSAVRSYRPHGSLARVLYDKRKADEWLTAFDKRRVSAMTLRLGRSPVRIPCSDAVAHQRT